MGTPVVGANLGSLPELISSGRTGFLFEPGSPASLAAAVRDAVTGPPEPAMRARCRNEYVERYGVDQNYDQLIDIYESAIDFRHSQP